MHFIISDIHGNLNTLKSLVKRIKTIDTNPTIVCTGDYIDRGLFSKQVVDYLIKIKAICIRGNHDDVFCYLLNNTHVTDWSNWAQKPINHTNVFKWFFGFGMLQTCWSYNIIKGQTDVHVDEVPYILNELTEKVPDTHKKFFNDLPVFWENDTHFVCHGYYDPSSTLPRNVKFISSTHHESALWSTYSANQTGGLQFGLNPVWDKIGVFGHSNVRRYRSERMVVGNKIRLIDTGFYGITAYCCENDTDIIEPISSKDFTSAAK